MQIQVNHNSHESMMNVRWVHAPWQFFLKQFVNILLWSFSILASKEQQASLEPTFYSRTDQISNWEGLKGKDINKEISCLTQDILFQDKRFLF